MNLSVIFLATLIVFVLGVALWTTGIGEVAVSAAGIATSPDKLGWMDDATLTESDMRRIASLKGQTYGSNLGVIQAMQGGISGAITRRDFELLRQDRRRARAAYPGITADELFTSGWVNVSEYARIPDSFCTSGNSNGTQGRDGKWYLDGGCYMSFVKAQYPKRASASETKTFLAAEKKRQRADELARLERDGTTFGMGGSGGSLSLICTPGGNCIVTQADEWATTGKEYTFPFVPSEWVDGAWSMDGIKKIPSFAKATTKTIKVQPSGMTMSPMTSSGRQFDGTLQPGESVSVGGTVELRQ